MKKLAVLVVILILTMVPVAALAGHNDDNDYDDNGKLVLSDAYLSSDLDLVYGPGSLDSVLDLEKKGVGFALSGLTSEEGTEVSDNFPLDVASGCTDSVIPGIYSDCSAFEGLKLKFKNLGTQGVMVNVNMNTGFTAGGGSCTVSSSTCDTFWQGQWTYLGPGKTKVVKLDFSNAEAWNIADDPDYTGISDGTTGLTIFRLDEVTNIGFQVIVPQGSPTPAATWLIVRGDD